MTDSHAAATTPRSSGSSEGRERRRHHHLRDLIDEMLASLRAAANRDIISAEDRADAERQLAAIMARVHAEALHLGDRRTT
jgi:hypothetical protein